MLRWCRDVVARVNGFEPSMKALADDGLRALTGSFRDRLSRGEPMADVLPEAFAAVREAAVRTLGQRPFDVQIIGGAVLHLGKVAEMKTGEGKTLTATLPAYLHALTGDGVHVMTANEYLASRDAEWMGPVYRFLGQTTGLLRAQPRPDPAARRPEYLADITYGDAHQFGYDYLRDNMVWSRDERVQRGHHFVLIDEADLILIDEMRNPMEISGPAGQAESRHGEFAALANRLERDADYEIDERSLTAALTARGTRAVEEHFGVGNLYQEPNLALAHYMGNAVKAKECFQRDRDYIVTGDQVVIIDEASGRPAHERRYGAGLHEAVEAKEGVPVRAEQQLLAMITMSDYLGLYPHLAGMTGTARTDVATYRQIYQRDVVTIPTNKPVIRVDHGDVIYRTQQSKLAGLAEEAATRHQAGRLGAVTVVARMAGRGVDIVLGGPDGAQREEVADRGGLCVLGAGRPAKRRLEVHLRGRAGRQGDPGEAKFFISYEDELVKAVGRVAALIGGRFLPDGDQIPRLSAAMTSIQARSAANEAAWLAQSREVDQVLGEQRRAIYAERAPAARGENMGERVRELISDVIHAQVTSASGVDLQADRFWPGLRWLYPFELAARPAGGVIPQDRLPRLAELAVADAQRIYHRREPELGIPVIRELERRVILSLLDRGWREQLLSTIGIRTKGEAALAEYRRAGSQAFSQLRLAVHRDIVRTLFYIRGDPAGPTPRD